MTVHRSRLEELTSILRENRVREELSKVRERFVEAMSDMYGEPFDADVDEFGVKDHPEMRACILHEQTLTHEFRDLVLSRLRRPRIITEDEIRQAFAQHVLLRSGIPFDEAYNDFLLAVKVEAHVERISEPIGTLTYNSHDGIAGCGFDLRGSVGYRLMDYGAGEFQAYISGILPAKSSEGVGCKETCYVTLVGQFSPGALADEAAEFTDVITSLLQNYYLPEQRAMEQRENQRLKQPPAGFPPEGAMPDESADDSHLKQQMFQRDLKELLAAHFDAPTKKDSIARRIRNAVHLLVQADRQSKHAVGLALSVASIESLVCSESSGMATMFADNVAILLEPDPTYRSMAVDFAKRLYDKRSRVLHGAECECSAEMLQNARLLAAAVMTALIRRRIHRNLAGYKDETPDELLLEMRNAKFLPRQKISFEEFPEVRAMWRIDS
jgi:hypothetical protein